MRRVECFEFATTFAIVPRLKLRNTIVPFITVLLLLLGVVVVGDAFGIRMIPSSETVARIPRCHDIASSYERRRPFETTTTEPRIQVRPRFRSVCCAASSNAMALDTIETRRLSRQYIQEGMVAFAQGKVAASIELFDQAERLDSSLTPYLWQRGLSYYYADQFAQASRQFRQDVRVNPYDVEEIVWDIASQLQASSSTNSDAPVAFPIANPMALPAGSTDRRRIMVRRVMQQCWIDL